MKSGHYYLSNNKLVPITAIQNGYYVRRWSYEAILYTDNTMLYEATIAYFRDAARTHNAFVQVAVLDSGVALSLVDHEETMSEALSRAHHNNASSIFDVENKVEIVIRSPNKTIVVEGRA